MLPLLWLWAFKLFLYVKHAMFVISKFPFHLLSFFMTKTRFFFFFAGGRVEWTSRCVLSMIAAATRTVMPRTAGRRPVWTHRCHLWYAPVESQCAVFGHMTWELRDWTSLADAFEQSKQSSSLSDRDTAEEDSDPLDDCGGFWRVQRRLQEEARVALALARPMARMQVEVERQIQLHRRSPVADLVSSTKNWLTKCKRTQSENKISKLLLQ